MTGNPRPSGLLRVSIFALFAVILLLSPGLAAASESHPMKYGRGLLWRVERDGQRPSHLFALFYYDDPSLQDLPAPVRDAFGQAEQLAFQFVGDELDLELFERSVTLPPGRSLRQLVDAKTYARVVAAAARYDVAADEVDGLTPFALSQMFSFPSELWTGFGAPEQAHAQQLVEWSLQDGKMVVPLETMQEGIGYIEQIPLADQVAVLQADLRMVGAIEAIYAGHLKAYRDGRTDFYIAYFDEAARHLDRAVRERFWDVWASRRNRKLATRLDSIFESGATFAGLQAFHLPGEEGILNLLEQRGYRLTRVY
jgi:uncharacterized protein YbaP (TraB family)